MTLIQQSWISLQVCLSVWVMDNGTVGQNPVYIRFQYCKASSTLATIVAVPGDNFLPFTATINGDFASVDDNRSTVSGQQRSFGIGLPIFVLAVGSDYVDQSINQSIRNFLTCLE